jgi:DNA-binding GntR family transcriptional regulator
VQQTPATPEEEGTFQQETAYRALRDGIARFDYKPGERLGAVTLCRELGLGRTPVRESLVRLQQEGLVQARAKSGTYVSRISPARMESARFVRMQIEREVVLECCSRIDSTALSLIANPLRQQRAAMDDHDQEAFFEADLRMHEAFFTIAGRHLAWDWLRSGDTDLQRYRWLRICSKGLEWDSIFMQHIRLCDAIAEHRPTDAAFLDVQHLRAMLDERAEVMAEYPDYFESE